MTIQTQRWRRFRQVVIELDLALLANLVSGVAGRAAHVEGSVPATALGNIHPDLVAGEAEVIFGSCAGFRQLQVELVG